jgi:hypothetical protein
MFKKIILLGVLVLVLAVSVSANTLTNNNNNNFVQMEVEEIEYANYDYVRVSDYILNFDDGNSTNRLKGHDYYESKHSRSCCGSNYDLLAKCQNAGYYKFYIPKEYVNNTVNNITLVWNVKRVFKSTDYKYPQTTLNVSNKIVEKDNPLDIKHEYKVSSLDHVKAVINGKTIWSYGY